MFGVRGSIARAEMVLTRALALHVAPPSVLLNIPPGVPAYRVVGVRGSITRDEIVTPLCEEYAGAAFSTKTAMATATTNRNARMLLMTVPPCALGRARALPVLGASIDAAST